MFQTSCLGLRNLANAFQCCLARPAGLYGSKRTQCSHSFVISKRLLNSSRHSKSLSHLEPWKWRRVALNQSQQCQSRSFLGCLRWRFFLCTKTFIFSRRVESDGLRQTQTQNQFSHTSRKYVHFSRTMAGGTLRWEAQGSEPGFCKFLSCFDSKSATSTLFNYGSSAHMSADLTSEAVYHTIQSAWGRLSPL